MKGFCIKGESKGTIRREDEKPMMIVSYARCIRVPAGSMAGLLQYSSSNRQTTSYLGRTAAVSSILTLQQYVPGPLSSLLSCMRVLLCNGHETHESRSLQR